ncbi:MAG: GNAT family N-acetyltransferase [Christensenellaceae bacterium]|jgi:predicted acetyltransferase
MREITLHPVAYQEKSVLRQLLELYQYDFSEFTGEEIGPHGFYEYAYLDHYWTEEDRYPYFIKVNGALAGFALVNAYTMHIKKGHAVAEFFIMRKYRRGGVGRQAAALLFDTQRGMWEVNVKASNLVAQKFWNAIITAYTAGDFGEHTLMMGDAPGQGFHFYAKEE